MLHTICIVTSSPVETGISVSYLIGFFLAFLILGYLIYTLVKPEKF